MKTLKLIIPALLMLVSVALQAQTDSLPKAKKSDTTNVKLGNTNITIIENKEGNKTTVTIDSTVVIDTDTTPGGMPQMARRKKKPGNVWAGVEIGVNSLLNADRSFSLTGADSPYSLNYAKSISVGINLFEQKIRLVKNNLYLSTGLGLEFNNFRFDDSSVKLDPNAKPLGFIAPDSGVNRQYTKSKLTAAYLNVPLLLTVAGNDKKGKNTVHFSVGAMVGFKYRSHQKMVYFEDGDKHKPKEFDNFNMNPFRFTAMARLGYKHIGVYANYSMNQLFLKGQGLELYPLTMGVSFLF